MRFKGNHCSDHTATRQPLTTLREAHIQILLKSAMLSQPQLISSVTARGPRTMHPTIARNEDSLKYLKYELSTKSPNIHTNLWTSRATELDVSRPADALTTTPINALNLYKVPIINKKKDLPHKQHEMG
jgi:hypothetical protein